MKPSQNTRQQRAVIRAAIIWFGLLLVLACLRAKTPAEMPQKAFVTLFWSPGGFLSWAVFAILHAKYWKNDKA